MAIFSVLYNKMIELSRHPHAPRYLYMLSFAESSFFPVPPDVMLAPMALARPERAFSYAAYTTLSSVLGAVLGYLIGFFCMHFLTPYIHKFGYAPEFLKARHYFGQYGFWVMFIAGFGPIPYKIFTITGGAMKIPLMPFLLGSIIGRGGRFFLVALLIRWKGETMEKLFLKYIDRAGWVVLFALVFMMILFYYK